MKFYNQVVFFLVTFLIGSQGHALTNEEVNKCFTDKENKQLSVFDSATVKYDLREIVELAKSKVEESKSCDDLKAKMKPMIDDIKKIMSINVKYKRQFNESLMKSLKELEKLKNEPNLPEDVSDEVLLYQLLLATEKNLDDSSDCTFNKGISIQCPEGFYKYVNGENSKEINSITRKLEKKKVEKEEADKKASSLNIVK